MGSARFRNNSGIVNMNSDPTTLQLHVAGSPTAATSVSFENSFDATMIMAVYAPNSTVTMQNNLSLIGALAGKHVHMQNNTQLTYHERIADIATGSSIRVYNAEDYVECTVAPTGAGTRRRGLLEARASRRRSPGTGRAARPSGRRSRGAPPRAAARSSPGRGARRRPRASSRPAPGPCAA